MNKTFNPKLDIIYFNSLDVLVTSGSAPTRIPGTSIINNTWYATFGSELQESSIFNYNGNKTVDENTTYLFYIGNDGSTIASSKWSEYFIENITTYAWYNGSWLTGDLLASWHGEGAPNLGGFDNYYTN